MSLDPARYAANHVKAQGPLGIYPVQHSGQNILLPRLQNAFRQRETAFPSLKSKTGLRAALKMKGVSNDTMPMVGKQEASGSITNHVAEIHSDTSSTSMRYAENPMAQAASNAHVLHRKGFTPHSYHRKTERNRSFC